MDYKKLIEKTRKHHLLTVEFSESFIKIKKQLGNNTGSQIEIEFTDSQRIKNIKFTEGGYSEPMALKQAFSDLFDLIYNT